MSVFGWFLSFVGFIGLIVGLLQMLKGKKLNSVPFRAPSQIAQLGPGAADAKGMVSTEGTVSQQGLLTAPMSGKPCLAFEITVERKYETTERTENGTETKKGSSNIFSDYKGGVFALQDGQGTVLVDATTKPDASFEKAHTSGVNVGILGIIPGTLQFGNFQMSTPLLTGEGRTTGFEGTEKIVPPSAQPLRARRARDGAAGAGRAHAEGHRHRQADPVVQGPRVARQVDQAQHDPRLRHGRRDVRRRYRCMGIFGPAPDMSASSDSSSCSSTLTADAVNCDGRMYERDGYDMKWTVPTAGEYTLTVTQPKVKYPIDPSLTVTDAAGKELAHDVGISKGAEAKITQKFEPGTYTLNVRDTFRDKVKGGYGFHLAIVRTPDAPAVASATITNAEVPATKPAAKAATPAAKGSAKPAVSAKAGAASGSAAPAKAPAAASAAKK